MKLYSCLKDYVIRSLACTGLFHNLDWYRLRVGVIHDKMSWIFWVIATGTFYYLSQITFQVFKILVSTYGRSSNTKKLQVKMVIILCTDLSSTYVAMRVPPSFLKSREFYVLPTIYWYLVKGTLIQTDYPKFNLRVSWHDTAWTYVLCAC